MKEKVCWTMDGRKKVFLVDDENAIVKELRDDGPLNEMEMKWVKSGADKPYKEWLKCLEEEEKEMDGEDKD